jgi:hypothetical protein
MALLSSACYTGPDAKHFAAVLDDLAVPGEWDLTKSEIRAPDGDVRCDPVAVSSCPAVTKTYLVEAEPLAAFQVAERMVSDAGFNVGREFIPTCDGPPTGPSCSFESKRDADRVRVTVYRSTHDAGLDNAPPGRIAVLVSAER